MRIEHTTQGTGIGSEFVYLCTLKEDNGLILESATGKSEKDAQSNLSKKILHNQKDSIERSKKLMKFIKATL